MQLYVPAAAKQLTVLPAADSAGPPVTCNEVTCEEGYERSHSMAALGDVWLAFKDRSRVVELPGLAVADVRINPWAWTINRAEKRNNRKV